MVFAINVAVVMDAYKIQSNQAVRMYIHTFRESVDISDIISLFTLFRLHILGNIIILAFTLGGLSAVVHTQSSPVIIVQ